MPKSQLDWLGVVALWIGAVVMAIKAGDLPLMSGAPSFLSAHWWNYVPVILVSVYMLIALYRLRASSSPAGLHAASHHPVPVQRNASEFTKRSVLATTTVPEPAPAPGPPPSQPHPNVYKKDARGRTFLSGNITPTDLMAMCEGKTNVQADRVTRGYLGKWLRYTGKVKNVYVIGKTTIVRFQTQYAYSLKVEVDDVELADVLHIGDEITVSGKIKEINSVTFAMETGEVETR